MKKNHGNSHIESILVSGFIFFLASLCQPLFAQSNATDYRALGSFAVETRLENWTDPARERTLPVKLYLPTGAPAGPVVIFSHGLGGSRESAAYLGNHWASHGIVGVFIQHPGADHMVFSGTGGLKKGPTPTWYKDVQSLTAAFSTAWWKAQLSEDESAKAWLAGGSAKSVLRAGDVINSKE